MEALFRELLSVVERDAIWLAEAGANCERLAANLPKDDKAVQELLAAAIVDKARRQTDLVLQMRQKTRDKLRD